MMTGKQVQAKFTRSRCGAQSNAIAVVLATLFICGCKAKPDATSESFDQPPHIALLQNTESDGPEAVSLSGLPLEPPPLSSEEQARAEQQLEIALAQFDEDPGREDAFIWVGRRLAYLGRYQQAINVFSEGLEQHPNSYKLLRHRGHRYITTRQFDRAIRDLFRAAKLAEGQPDEIEPDGKPNAQGVPTSTNQSNIFYHLGLAHYLKGNYEKSSLSFRKCMEFATNDDMHVATAYWLHLSLRRLLRNADAAAVLDPISPDMNIHENTGYHKLLLLYKDAAHGYDVPPVEVVLQQSSDSSQSGASASRAIDAATVGYGLGILHALDGNPAAAHEHFRHVVAETHWAAFGHIAAEVELTRQTVASR